MPSLLLARASLVMPRMAVGAWYPVMRRTSGRITLCVDDIELELPESEVELTPATGARASVGSLSGLPVAVCPSGHNHVGDVATGRFYYCDRCRAFYVPQDFPAQ